MRITVQLLRQLNACEGGIARFREEFRHRPIEITEDLWERTRCDHIASGDVSWLAGRLLQPEDAVIFRVTMEQNAKDPKIDRMARTDWSLYCRTRARVALAVLGALIPLCDVRR